MHLIVPVAFLFIGFLLLTLFKAASGAVTVPQQVSRYTSLVFSILFFGLFVVSLTMVVTGLV